MFCLQPIQLLNYNVELAKPGRFPSGTTEIPFEMPLRAKGSRQLYETYHGVFVNIQVRNCFWRWSFLNLLACYLPAAAQTN